MLRTPVSFIPLLSLTDHSEPHTFLFRGYELLIRESDLSLPDIAVCEAMQLSEAELHPVGLLNDRYCRTGWVHKETTAPEGFAFKSLRALFGAMDEQLVTIGGRAFQIAEWARTHRFCGACGTPTVLQEGERCLQCPSCGHVSYPRISPAMMVLIKKGDAILLARHAAAPSNRFSPLAGFLEPGETIEEAVHREVMEEVGLTIKNVQYFGSQSWPFPHSLMIAFTADYAGGDITVDQHEIMEARWFGPGDTLPEYTQGISISGELINAHLPRHP